MFFSKSKYCQFAQCPKLLWLDTYHRELKTENEALDDRMITGNEIGDLAMGLFGNYTEVTVLKDDGSPDIPAMIEKTQQCIGCGVENICEASFSYEGLYCAVDILLRQDSGYAIFEVKSSTHAQPQYATDIAYQRYVLEKCGVNITGTYLICINPAYVRGDELDVQQLFQIIDMAEMVEAEYEKVAVRLQQADAMLNSDTEPVIEIGEHCETPYHCPYWQYCTSKLPQPSVFDLYRMSLKKKVEYNICK